MRVLVTGSNGMVGKHLQEYVKSLFDHEFNFFFATRQDANLENIQEVQKLFELTCPDIVVHLAANVGGVYYNFSFNESIYDSNVKMNLNVFNTMEEIGVKYAVFILSTCVYPDIATRCSDFKPLLENNIFSGPPHPSNSGYALSKRLLYRHSIIHNQKFKNSKYICLAPTNLYGEYDPGLQFPEKAHVIPALIGQLVKTQFPYKVKGNLESTRQYLYAKDLARFIYMLLERFQKSTCTCMDLYDLYNVTPSPGHKTTLKELADLIFGTDNYVNIKDNLAQHCRIASDSQLIEHFPKFVETLTPLSEGLSIMKNS